MRKLPIQWVIVFVIIAVVFFFGCKTAEPFGGDGDATKTVMGRPSDTVGYWAAGAPLEYNSMGTSDFIGGFGQDTIPNIDTSSYASIIAQLKDIYATPTDMGNYRYLDTIRALLLCADTARYYTGSEGWYEIDPTIHWRAGYIVIERFAAWAKFAWLFTPAEPVFLDRRKQLLKSNIIVWMVKELN